MGDPLELPTERLAQGCPALGEPEAKALLRAHGIATPRGVYVPVDRSVEGELDGALGDVLDGAVRHVVKAVSPEILNRSG